MHRSPQFRPALATAIASEAGQALAIGAIKIGTRRVYFSQKALARARAGCWDMPLQTIGGHTYSYTLSTLAENVELEDTALLSSEADVPARDPHRLMRRSPDFPFLGNKQPQLLVFA